MEENNNENKQENNKEFKTATPLESKQYKVFEQPKKEKKSSTGFGKTVALPFLCGVLGAGIVVGSCVGVPGIRDELLKQMVGTTSNSSTSTSSSTGELNTKLLSLAGYSDTAVSVASKVKPSIVGISVEYSVSSIFNRGSSTAKAEGSGVIISSDGYILTNNHVVSSSTSESNSYYQITDAGKVTVTLFGDETEYEAKIVGQDEQTDLAVIKIEKTGLTKAEFADSDSVKVGEFAMAVGNPLDLGTSITCGVVSALNRKVQDSDGNTTYTCIQTDAAINSGNSGGALVNSQGQVIGINTLKVASTGVEGIGFAIPINSTTDIIDQLKTNQKVKRPYIGISGRDLDDDTAKRYNLVKGVYVVSVDEYSAAEKAGLKTGDVIVGIDDKSISTMNELNEIKNTHSIGDTVKLKINRDGQEKEISLTLGEQNSN